MRQKKQNKSLKHLHFKRQPHMDRIMGLLILPRLVLNPIKQILIKNKPNTKKQQIVAGNPIISLTITITSRLSQIRLILTRYLGIEIKQ